MDKLEKAIKGFEKCLDKKTNCFCEDIGCPYADECWLSDKNLPTRPLMEDAFELLKEKQPRLLTLEEVKQAEVVWCEWGCAEGYVVCMLFDKIDPDGDYRLIESNGGGLYYSSSEYNESWRCWSARPTDEQMKATEWDGDGE